MEPFTSSRFERNLRPIIAELIENSKTPDLGVPEFQNLIDQKQSLTFRILWFFIVKLCLCICCYQIAESVKFLLTYPIAVDLYMGDLTSSYIPVITLCSAENKYVLSQLGKGDTVYECMFPLNTLLKRENLDYDAMWNIDEPSLTYISHEFLNNIVIDNITINKEKTFLGQCIVFGDGKLLDGKLVRTNIKIHIKKGKLCDQSITLVSIRDKIDFRLIFLSRSGYALDATFAKRNYKFLHTPRQACSSIEEFENCYENCLEKHILEFANCRMPFFPPSFNFSQCSNVPEARRNYEMIASFYTNPKTLHDCRCVRTCNNELYTVFPNTLPWFQNESTFIIKLDPIDLGFTERLAYDTFDLLTDIGGNLGLFMGLSILSILNIIFVIFTTIMKRYSVRRNTIISHRVRTIFHEVYERDLSEKLNITTRPKRNPTIKWLNFFMTTFCVCLAIYMIQERVKYYFTYPVRHVVEVKEKSKIVFPSYTICGVSEKIAMYKRTYAKANSVSNWCELDMFDLLRGKRSKKLADLWSKSEPQFLNSAKYVLQVSTGVPAVDPNYTTISTYLGLCSHLKFKEETYSGFFTMFVVAYSNTALDQCRNNYYDIFYDDLFSDTYNVINRIEAPVPGLAMTDYRLTKLKRLNTKHRRCVEKIHFTRCKEKCLKEQLQSADSLCSLPFLSFLNNLTECSTPETAKQTREKYVKILTGVTLGTTCSCINPCTENIFTMSGMSVLQPPGPFVLGFLMNSNIQENIIEVEKYSIVAMLSDIGNSFGLAVGLSVLTASQHLGHIFSYFAVYITKAINKLKRR